MLSTLQTTVYCDIPVDDQCITNSTTSFSKSNTAIWSLATINRVTVGQRLLNQQCSVSELRAQCSLRDVASYKKLIMHKSATLEWKKRWDKQLARRATLCSHIGWQNMHAMQATNENFTRIKFREKRILTSDFSTRKNLKKLTSAKCDRGCATELWLRS